MVPNIRIILKQLYIVSDSLQCTTKSKERRKDSGSIDKSDNSISGVGYGSSTASLMVFSIPKMPNAPQEFFTHKKISTNRSQDP